MELQIMYPPQKDSPTTFLLGAITTTDTSAVVGSAGLLPKTVPFPLTLGPDKPITETVMVTSVDLVANRITFERGPGALPWDGGTTVGRVFNAQDLKTVQDNISSVGIVVSETNDAVAAMADTIGDIENTIGDSDSGLVKDLNDEVVRAKAAEAAETLRATTAEEALESSKIDKGELPQVIIDASYEADATKLTTTLTRYNASNKEVSNYDRFIPLITSDSVGLMTPEAYNEITSLRNDVMALQQEVASKVPMTRTINSKTLSANITLTAEDLNANTLAVNATLSTSWSGQGPYTQNLSIPGMTATKNATVGLASTASQAEREAARDGIFSVTAQTTNQITITADGTKPTITIPISVILMP